MTSALRRQQLPGCSLSSHEQQSTWTGDGSPDEHAHNRPSQPARLRGITRVKVLCCNKSAFVCGMCRIHLTSSHDPLLECMQDFFSKLGKEKSGFGSGKAPFWERISFVLWTAAQPDPAAAEATLAQNDEFSKWKKKYDQSRRTVTRTGKHQTCAPDVQAKLQVAWWANCFNAFTKYVHSSSQKPKV